MAAAAHSLLAMALLSSCSKVRSRERPPPLEHKVNSAYDDGAAPSERARFFAVLGDRSLTLDERTRSIAPVIWNRKPSLVFPDAAAPTESLRLEIASQAVRKTARPGTRSCGSRPTCEAVEVTVQATNVSTTPIHFELREEWHGGSLPGSSIIACVRPRSKSQEVDRCGEVYVVEHAPSDAKPEEWPREITLESTAQKSFDLRFDYSGTGSTIGYPFVEPDRDGIYDVVVGLIFEARGSTSVTFSRMTTVAVPGPGHE